MRILCPWHKERTPSLQVYHNGFCCFGCGRKGTLSELGMREGVVPKRDPEDLEKSLEYIDSLPRKAVRGLSLPADDEAYYIVWPCRRYYKKRYFEPRGPKYIGSAGHEKPAFVAQTGKDVAVLVEGELNALSLAHSVSGIGIVSPGGAGDFSTKVAKKYLPSILCYSMLLIMVDADKAGALAVIEAMSAVKGKGLNIKYSLMPEDFNSLLVKGGRERVKAEVEAVLGRVLETSTKE